MGDKIKIVPHTEVFADSEIVMRVIGYNHYKLSDGSGEFAGVVFDMVGVMNSKYRMNSTASNSGGWAAMELRSYLNDTIFHELPQNWKTLIKEVEVLSNVGGLKSDIGSSNNKLFLLSLGELGYGASSVPYKDEIDPEADEVIFAVYTDNKSRLKGMYNNEGTVCLYWSRTPDINTTNHFSKVFTNGSIAVGYAGIADFMYNTVCKISFIFCM